MGLCDDLQRASRGDRQALDAVLIHYYPRVQAIVHDQLRRDLRPRHRWIWPLFSTGDIVQEVFLGVVRSYRETAFENDDALLGYLATLVRHRLIDALRFHEADRRDQRRELDAPTEQFEALAGAAKEAAPLDVIHLAEQVRVFRTVLATFSERHQQLLQLRLEEDLTFPELATRLGYASAETARQAFHDAQAQLLLRLRRHGVRWTCS